MGTPQRPLPVKLFLAIMYTDTMVYEKALGKFIESFGLVEQTYGPLTVSSFTTYYNEEMGAGLQKIYLTFKKPIERKDLSAIKIMTNTIESHYGNTGKRQVNMDPGYITNDKFVLATTKDFYHRVYINEGIYAEVTLHYRRGMYRYFSWTYPDYKQEGVQKLLEHSRAILIHDMRMRQRKEQQ